MNEKLKEILGFIITAGVLVGIGYYTGIFKNFDISGLTKNIPSASSITDSSPGKGSYYTTANYISGKISPTHYTAAKRAMVWYDVFSSNKKVIFYVYSDTPESIKFNKQIAVYAKSASNAYLLRAFDVGTYKVYKTGNLNIKVCNSFDECNENRKRATEYTKMADFMDKCSQTMCIFDNSSQKYVMLKKRDASAAISVLKKFRSSRL